MDVFGDLEYLGSKHKKRGNVDVFGGMECVRGEEKNVWSKGFYMLRE